MQKFKFLCYLVISLCVIRSICIVSWSEAKMSTIACNCELITQQCNYHYQLLPESVVMKLRWG